MKRWVYRYEIVDGDPKELARILCERIRELMVEATGSPEATPEVDGAFILRMGGELADIRTTKEVRATTGVASVSGSRTRIPVTWHAAPAKHAFPAFDGSVELEPLSARHAQLTVVGNYTIPFGVLGAAIDGLALSTIAERTIKGLARALAERLEEHATSDTEPFEVEPPTPKLALRVRDVMTPDPMVFDETLSLRTAALLLVYRGVQGAPVVSATGELVGVLSEQDLLEKEAAFRPHVGRGAKDRERRRQAVTVGEACSRPARVTVPEARLREAARAMLDHQAARLVVVDGSSVAGIITRHDVLKALLRSDAELQAAVDTVIRSLSEPDVRATVVWGEVTLSGVAELRSKVPHLVRMISEIDGVVAVHGEPTWTSDDVTTSVYGTPA